MRAALVVAFALAGCAAAPPDRGDRAAALLAADRAFAERSADMTTADAFEAFVAPDGLQLPAQGEPVRGVTAIAARLRAEPPSRLLWTPREAEVSADGMMGWTWGDWQAYALDEPARPLAAGRYVNVWKRQPDGSWKVRVDLGNVARPPPQ